MGRWLEISCFLLFLFYFSSQDSVYGNKIDMTGIKNAKNSRKLDLVFLIHTSTQINDRSFELVKTFLKNLLRDSDIDSGDVRVGMAFYDRNPNILFNLPQYKTKADLIGAIDAIPPSYRSDEANLARGLKVAKQIMLSSSNDQRPDVPNAVVVITDGTSSFDSNEIHTAAVDLKSISYIFGVAIGIGTFGEMARIVTEPANVNYFGIVAIERLHEVEPQLTEQIMALQGDAAPLDVPTNAKADIVFLVHMSKATSKADQNLLKMFMKKLLTSADIDSGAVRVAIVTYNVNSKVISNFDTHTTKADVFNTIDNMNRFKGPKANAAAGLRMVLNKISINKSGDRPNVKNVLIMVTDQQSAKAQNSKRIAQKLRGKKTKIFTIGVGFDTSTELKEIANQPAGVHAQFVENYSKLNEANDLLLQSIPSLDVMKKPVPRSTNRPAPVDNTIYQTTTPSVVTRPTGRPIPTAAPSLPPIVTAPPTPKPTTTAAPTSPPKVLSTGPPAPPVEVSTVRTPPGPDDKDGVMPTAVIPTPKPPTSETGQDIVLMLDSSVPDDKFFLMLVFARTFVGMADFDSGKVRIGLLFFNSDAKIEAHLNTFHLKADLLQAVDMLPQSPGKSNKAKAFNEVRKNMFTIENGDRPKAENKVILITGSKTSDIAKAEKRAEELRKESKAEIFVLGLGDTDPNELYSFASAPENEHVYQVNSAETVLNIIEPLLERVKRVYVPPPTTTRRTRPTTVSTKPTVPVTTPPRPIITRKPTTQRTTRRTTTPRTTTRRTTPRRTTPRRPIITTPKRIYRPSDCTNKADILFIVDSSGSVGDENFAKVIDFVYSTIDSLDIESGLYNVALITFSDEARTEFYLNSFTLKEDIENATAAVKYVYGSTHTAIALRMARRMIFTEVNGDRADAPNIVIIITDGQSNINHRETLPQARLLKQSGVSVITVAVGFATQTEELIGMTSPPVAENLFSVDDFSELENLHARIVEPICKGQHFCQNNPCKNGGECYDTLKHYICICAKGFYGTECDKVCPQPADVAFILDSSTSVGWRTFQRMKRFAESMVRDLAIGYCGHRIALVKYSSRPLIEFHLNRFNRQESVIRSIDDTSYTRGHANMANAIKFVSQEIFSPRHGDRDGVKNIAYLLTHGQIDLSREDTLRQAELAISSGIHIIPVAFNVRRSYELDTIAAAQGIKTTEIFGADVAGMTDSLLHPIFETRSHCEPNPCLNGGKCVNYPFTYKCECKRGFTGENCEKQCNSRADMILVIDTSRYVTRPALRRVKRMLRRTIKRLSFSHQNIRVAIITYDAEPRLRLTLDKGRHKQDVMGVLSMLRPGRTDPNPGAALRMANQDVLRQKFGDRLHVPNYLVLVTKSVRDLDEMLVQSRNLKMKGTRIMALGLVSSTSFVASSLNDVVSPPLDKNKFIITNDTKEEHVADVIQKLAAAVCYEEICSENPCLNGGTCQIDKGSAVCDCPRGYAGRWCQSTCAQNVDVVFVLDTSGNISPGEFRLMKEFAIEIADKLSIGTHKSRVAAVTYSSRARLGFTLDMFSSARDVRNALSSLLYEYGNSNAVAALELVRSKIFNYKTGDRPDVKNFVIYISNTESKIHPEHTVASARALRNIAHIYAIGIANYDLKELHNIASLPYLLNVFTSESYEGLFNYTNKIAQSFCKASTFCDSNPCQNNGVCEPASSTFRCKCADGYAGRFCERRCEIVKDIAFVLDSSSSVGEINFERMLDFTSKLVDDLADRNMRYALITYSNTATLVFTFSRYSDAETVASIIKRTAYKPGSTNTASALANAADIFSIDYGSRLSAEKVVILITDGLSNVDYHLTVPNAQRLKARVNKVMAIGVGLDNTEEIRQIASDEKFMYTVQDFTLLEDVENDIVGDTCLMQNKKVLEDDIEMEIETDSDDFNDDVESETDNNYESVTRPLSVA